LKSRRLLITEVFFSFSKHALPKTKRLQLNKKLRTSLIYVKLEAKAEDCKTLQTPLVSQRVLLTGRPQTCWLFSTWCFSIFFKILKSQRYYLGNGWR